MAYLLIPFVIHEGLFASVRIDKTCQVSVSVIGTDCLVSVFADNHGRLIPGIIGLSDRISLGIGLGGHVTVFVIAVRLRISVFIGVLHKKSVLIVFTHAQLAVTVGGFSFAVVKIGKGRNGIGFAGFLPDDSAFAVVCVGEEAHAGTVGAGQHSSCFIVGITQAVPVYVGDTGQAIFPIAEVYGAFVFITDLCKPSFSVLLQEELFASDAIGYNDKSLAIFQPCLKAEMVNNPDQPTACVIIFGMLRVTVHAIGGLRVGGDNGKNISGLPG